ATAQFAGSFVGVQGLCIVIQHDLANSNVVESRDNSLNIPIRQQLRIGPFVALECLTEPVLPMEEVADVDLKASKAGDVARSKKDFPCMVRCSVRSIILAQQDERLNRTAQGASGFNRVTHLLKQRDRSSMEFGCRPILAQAPQGIPFRAQGV